VRACFRLRPSDPWEGSSEDTRAGLLTTLSLAVKTLEIWPSRFRSVQYRLLSIAESGWQRGEETGITSDGNMSLNQVKLRPKIFLSFAGEDLEWKQSLFRHSWWSSLLNVADIFDYENDPESSGDLYLRMGEIIRDCDAFVVILSKYYLSKSGIVEHEFQEGVELCARAPVEQRLFCPIINDDEALRWWREGKHEVFEQHAWLRDWAYWALIEDKEPAILGGDLEPRYARQVREYARKLADRINKLEVQNVPQARNRRSIILLGHPIEKAEDYAAANPTVVTARSDLTKELKGREVAPDCWEDGWLKDNERLKSKRGIQLQSGVDAIVRPLGPKEAIDLAITPEITPNQLLVATGQRSPPGDFSKLKISLWLPSEHRTDPDAKIFVETASAQAASSNPRLYVSSVREIANLLVPSAAAGNMTQISIEELDDIEEIEAGRTARKIVEEALRTCVMEGARQAKVQLEPPLVRQFLNYQKLAAQIADAEGAWMVLVAHDLQEHLATTTPEAHRVLGRKLRKIRENVEDVLARVRGQLIPITLVVTNYTNLRNDSFLDEEIAGMKWRLLAGQLNAGKFEPEPDLHGRLVGDIAKLLQQPGVRA